MPIDLILVLIAIALVAFVILAARFIWERFVRTPSGDIHAILQELVETELDPRERRVLALRFGLYGEPRSWTLEEIAARLGVTRERVREIEEIAMTKLQKGLAARGIKAAQVNKMLSKK